MLRQPDVCEPNLVKDATADEAVYPILAGAEGVMFDPSGKSSGLARVICAESQLDIGASRQAIDLGLIQVIQPVRDRFNRCGLPYFAAGVNRANGLCVISEMRVCSGFNSQEFGAN